LKPDSTNESTGIFDLKLTDEQLLTLVKEPINTSKDYWDNTFGLIKIRKDNMDMWLPNHNKDKSVYDYQEENMYQEPRIFISVETICSVVNARISMPSVAPGQDTVTSNQLAEDVSRAMFAYSTKYQIQDIFRICTRNLMIKRAAFIKLRFDKSIGKHGEIVTEIVLPEDIIVDKDAKWNETPRFIAQVIKDKSFEELAALFPEATQKIYELAGTSRRNGKGELVAYKTQLSKKQTIYEVWFKYFDEGVYKAGLMWVDNNFQKVLGKMDNPNWNYEEKDGITSNILDNPEPPFISFNYLNDGSSYIDITSTIEQASTMQKIVDKRGFQIMDSADQAGSGKIFNTNMITKEDIARLTGSPDESVGVKGNVSDAMMRVPPAMLPNYVFEDKIDARQQIDDIFGTHDISRGKDSGNKTLGQDKLQVNQDYTRIDEISRSVLRSAVKYYKYLAQLMKVYYTDEHWFKATGEDGQFDFIMMKNDLIEDGIDITVEEGSNMPMNKGQQQEFATGLAQLGMIDPLTLYEVGSGMQLPSPKKMLERLMTFQSDPMAFAGLAKTDEVNRHAMADIMILNNGELPKIRNEITPEYLTFFTNYMLGIGYKEALKRKPEVEQLYMAYLQGVQAIVAEQLAQLETQMPTQKEIDVQNQKAVQTAEMGNTINPTDPTTGQPPKPTTTPQ